MKKHSSDKQIISILREAEAGVSAESTPFPTPPFTPGVRTMEVPEVKRLKSSEAENARLRKLLAEAC